MSAIDGRVGDFDPEAWDDVPGFEDLTDLTYHRAKAHGTVRIAFDRPDVLNAFRPHTVDELLRVLEHARTSRDVGCVLLTGNGPSAEERQAGVLHRRRPADPRAGPVTSTRAEGETADTVDKARLGAAAHPRVPAADPLHAEGRDLRRPRLGGRRRPLACTSSAT